MTNPTPHGQVPEALRLADELEDSLESHDGSSLTARCQGIADDAAAELRRLHARIAELEAQIEAIGAGGVGPHRAVRLVEARDEALIRQLVDALEQSQPYVESCANGKRVQGWGEQLDRAQDAINAARARLEQPSGPAASRGVAFFVVTSAHPAQHRID